MKFRTLSVIIILSLLLSACGGGAQAPAAPSLVPASPAPTASAAQQPSLVPAPPVVSAEPQPSRAPSLSPPTAVPSLPPQPAPTPLDAQSSVSCIPSGTPLPGLPNVAQVAPGSDQSPTAPATPTGRSCGRPAGPAHRPRDPRAAPSSATSRW